jgi:hypothetical protein
MKFILSGDKMQHWNDIAKVTECTQFYRPIMRMPGKLIISPLNGEKFLNTGQVGDKTITNTQ